MFSPTRVPTKPTGANGASKLASSTTLLKQAARRGPLRRWAVRLLIAAVVVVVLVVLFLVAVRIITNDMWFNSVHAGSVYTTILWARVLLFAVFGVVAAVVGGLSMFAVRRIRPALPLSQDNDTFRWMFRRYEPRVGRLLVVLAAVVPGVLVGQQAASGWQNYVLWLHAQPFHSTDPLFGKDTSFYVEVYPFHAMVVGLLVQAVTYALWIAVIAGYWYGAWRLRRGRKKVTAGFTTLASLLLAAFLALKAVSYWLSRYSLTTSTRGPVTGPSYTDAHAALPGKYALMVIAILCALALLANAFLVKRVRVIGGALVLMVVASVALVTAWPGVFFHFREAPSAASLDLGEIADNQKATMSAFGLDGDISTVAYSPPRTTDVAALQKLASETAQTSVLDPNQLSPTFNVEQQLQAYYGFKSTLDVSNYTVNGRSQDVVIAARELQSSGIPKPSWVNNHIVYTHGYGVVAAPTTTVNSATQSPIFLNGGMPPAQQIPVTRPQIYFGQAFGSGYAIVGQPAGSRQNVEFDHPAGSGSSTSAHTTYRGDGGIPVGSAMRRLLLAVQLRDPNIFFSSEINSASQLLMIRSPRARVAAVAPWLTLEGDVYPAVVDGHIKWIVDGYTTSSNYPNSQLVNLHSATTTTLTAQGASVVQPNTQLNYMRNSVKAVVDAYTGSVSLYEWNQNSHPDPLLKSWESVFPGLVKPQSGISPALLAQLRYPTDLFNVQRSLLARYHVSDPRNFYSGNDFWKVPNDPTVGGSASTGSNLALPSKYVSMAADGYGGQHFSLSSPMVTLNGRQLASFVYVNSEPGPDYGKFTVLEFPSGSGGESPAQVQNDIESDTDITEALTLQRGGNSRVVLGNLQAIPLAGQILYVEPVYTRSSGSSSFPILRHVIALYANGDPSFQDTLGPAIRDAIKSGVTR